MIPIVVNNILNLPLGEEKPPTSEGLLMMKSLLDYNTLRTIWQKRKDVDPQGACDSSDGARRFSMNLGHSSSSVSTETWPLEGRKELGLPRTTHMCVEGSDLQVTEWFLCLYVWLSSMPPKAVRSMYQVLWYTGSKRCVQKSHTRPATVWRDWAPPCCQRYRYTYGGP